MFKWKNNIFLRVKTDYQLEFVSKLSCFYLHHELVQSHFVRHEQLLSMMLSLMLSKLVSKPPYFEVKTLILVETWPTNVLVSISVPPVVCYGGCWEQCAKASLMSLIRPASVKLFPLARSTVITKQKKTFCILVVIIIFIRDENLDPIRKV